MQNKHIFVLAAVTPEQNLLGNCMYLKYDWKRKKKCLKGEEITKIAVITKIGVKIYTGNTLIPADSVLYPCKLPLFPLFEACGLGVAIKLYMKYC